LKNVYLSKSLYLIFWNQLQITTVIDEVITFLIIAEDADSFLIKVQDCLNIIKSNN
jgi:hypothetical protein